jgi:hypothetical protein
MQVTPQMRVLVAIAPSAQPATHHCGSSPHAGVDLVTISHWLGHASPDTTNRYAIGAIDLDHKRRAIAKVRRLPVGVPAGGAATPASSTGSSPSEVPLIRSRAPCKPRPFKVRRQHST